MRAFGHASLLALSLACATDAHAQSQATAPCAPDGDGMPTGPAQLGLRDGDLGVPRRMCPRTEIALGGTAYAVIEPDAFYGNLRVATPVGGSFAVDDTTELFGALEVVRYQTVISSLEAEQFGLGDTSVGLTHAPWRAERSRAGVTARLVMPTASARDGAVWPFGLDAGVGVAHALGARLVLHAQTGALSTIVAGGSPPPPRAAWATTAGAAWRPWRWLQLVVDAHVELGYAAALDVFALAPALRFAGGAHFGAELGAMLPLAGRERALAAADLRLSLRL